MRGGGALSQLLVIFIRDIGSLVVLDHKLELKGCLTASTDFYPFDCSILTGTKLHYCYSEDLMENVTPFQEFCGSFLYLSNT